jgi:hypothetical protein
MIFGPEGSGTKFLTKCLLLATKGHGEAGDSQTLGNNNIINWPISLPETIVFRRSLPHGGNWPAINSLFNQFENKGYQVIPILIIRDFEITVKSQMAAGHVKSEETARANIRKSQYIYNELPTMPIIVTYEALILPHLRKAFFIQLGLKFPEISVVNGNLKHLKN